MGSGARRERLRRLRPGRPAASSPLHRPPIWWQFCTLVSISVAGQQFSAPLHQKDTRNGLRRTATADSRAQAHGHGGQPGSGARPRWTAGLRRTATVDSPARLRATGDNRLRRTATPESRTATPRPLHQ